jgi:hypothetical protein
MPNPDRLKDRSGHAWREWRKACRYRDQMIKAPCQNCRQPIDYEIPPNAPNIRPYNAGAYEPDHIKPVQTHPHMAYMVSNGGPSHAGCNRSRQDKPLEEPEIWVQAEDWD